MLGKQDGTVERDAVGSRLGRMSFRGEGEGLVEKPEQWTQRQSHTWEVQPQVGTGSLSPSLGAVLGWFPLHFLAAALPAPKAVIKCRQTHNYHGAAAGGHTSSAGVFGALPLCTCLCAACQGRCELLLCCRCCLCCLHCPQAGH